RSAQRTLSRKRLTEVFPRQLLIRLHILRACLLDDLTRQRWRRAVLVPSGRLQPIAYELLVERRRVLARLIRLLRPKARAIGRQYFVDQNQRTVRQLAPLELRIREDDAARF